MRVFGFEIKRASTSKDLVLHTGPDIEVEREPIRKRAAAAMASTRNAFGIRTIPRSRVVDSIVFPAPISDDVWDQQSLLNAVSRIEKMFAQDYFDICDIDRIIKDFKLDQAQFGYAGVAYKKLRSLHCVHYNTMLPGIAEQIPELITTVFSEGRLPVNKDALRIAEKLI